MIKVKRISHATLETPDIERQVDYQTNILGLSVAGRTDGCVFMKTAMGQTAVVLRKGQAPRCAGLAFQVDPALPIAELQRQLSESGIMATLGTDSVPGIGETITFHDPNGTQIDLFTQGSFLEEDRIPKAFVPLKLGHLAFKTNDVHAMADFYSQMLGFRVSDWRSDFFVWMRCGPDHHTVNFVRGEKVKMHHIAFEVADRAEMLRACDFLGRNRHTVIWGPGRHVIGDNVFTYHRDPDGNVIELYCELARIDSEEIGYFMPRPWRDDRPYLPGSWGDGTMTNLWGAGPPPGFGD